MPVTKADLQAFLDAQKALDDHEAALKPLVAARDAAAAKVAAELTEGQTVATVPNPPPVVQLQGGNLALVTHDYPET